MRSASEYYHNYHNYHRFTTDEKNIMDLKDLKDTYCGSKTESIVGINAWNNANYAHI